MDRPPLGDYQRFRFWFGRPRPWGPEGSGWRAWFGGKVVDGLCDVLDEHAAARGCGYHGNPAAIGCVPWLTSSAVVHRLMHLRTCIVLDKGAWPPRRLIEHGQPFPNVLPGLRLTSPASDGDAAILGPYSPMPAQDVGPVRFLGWNGKDSGKPLLHAKLLVLGYLHWVEFGPDGGPTMEELVFTPRSVWWGSANWTDPSRSHLEVGFWSDNDALASEATTFIEDVIRFSEPVGSTCAGPAPDLVEVEFDDDAMAETARESWLSQLADEDDEGG